MLAQRRHAVIDKTAHAHRRLAAFAVDHVDRQRRQLVGGQDAAQLRADQVLVNRVAQAPDDPRAMHGRIDRTLHRGAAQACTRLEVGMGEIPVDLIGAGDQAMLLEPCGYAGSPWAAR